MKKIPVDYLAHKSADSKLKAHLGLNSECELLDYLGCDFFYLPGRDISQNEGALPFYRGKLPAMTETETERICPLGIRWRRGAYASKFTVDEAISGPLQKQELTVREILDFPWPEAGDYDFSPLLAEAEANSGRIRIGGLWTGIMGDSYRMHGFENFLLNIAINPEVIHALIDRMTDMYLDLNDKCFSMLKGKMEVWFFGNDFGSQESLLLGREMWTDFFFENIKRLCALAHSYNLKVMMHSCGAISDLIPLLIEAGVDILDPIQVTAKGMNPADLADKFGGKITFHGGIDTQDILPRGTAEDVRNHVREVVGALAPTGRYIFAPSQILGPDIPVTNILSMYEARGEINGRIDG
ncbi:MAG: uroporphyrinogen decarboxylase family protein [Victivallales bacterium]